MKCSECGLQFPDELITTMCINGRYQDVCGVCALKITRRVHRQPNYQFGEDSQARILYLMAKAHNEKRKGGTQ